jgi:hypothetical protein
MRLETELISLQESLQQERARAAWRGAMVAVALNLIGMPLGIMIARSIPEAPIGPALASMCVATVLLAALVTQRKRPQAEFANLAFLVNALAVLAALWVTNRVYAESGKPWVPFQANKLGMVTVALLAPEPWVGVLSIALHVLAAVAQLSTFGAATRARIAVGEPWPTLAFGVFALVLFGYRLRRAALEWEVARSHAEKAILAGVARRVLAIRDLSNTPLQTIVFATAAARLAHPQVASYADRIDRAVAQIRAVDARFREYERQISWTRREESFDSASVLWAKPPRSA